MLWSNVLLMAERPRKLREMQRGQISHLLGHVPSMAAGPLGQWDSLPYAELNGPGLERLCFRLLLADRKVPRYFGDNGEAQFGIDLIVSNGDDCTVFQCKNHANFEIGEFKALLAKFEQEWLRARAELPKPVEFVVVWPVMHTERQDVETVKKDFFEHTGVRVEVWHRDILDHRLRDLPDIVADLFSLHAVQRFCTRQNWDADIFRPLEPNSGDRRAVGRFLDLLRDNRVVLDPSAVERFDEILGSQAVAILSGASGSGKTITSLALAKGFDDGAWRVFYINLRQQVSEQQLVNGVRQRSISPTVFIFDDAHLNLDLVQRTIDRLADILGDRWVRIAVVMQAAGIGSDDYDGPIQDFIEECTTGKAVIELVATEARYAAIVARSRPDLPSLSDERLRRLVALSGRSLALLDEVLPLFATVDDLDTVDLEQIFPLVLRRYFKKEKGGVSAPALKRLAGLGQFDVVVPVEDLPDPFEPRWEEVVNRLTLTFGRPESRAFFHASVAELLFRTLSWADGDNDWIEAVAKVWVARLGSACAINPVDLPLFLRSRLRLVDDLPLKQRILCDKTLLATLEKGRGGLRVEWLSLMVMLTRAVEPEPPFAAWMMDQIVRMVAEPTNVGTGSVGKLGLAFREIGLRDPEQTHLRKLEEQIGPGALLALLRERADLAAFLGVLQHTSVEFAGRLTRALDPLTVAALLQHTREWQGSVGAALAFTLRELGLRDPEQTQLRDLDDKIGSDALLGLLRERADLSAFLNVLQYTSAEFAGRLIRALDPLTVAALLQHTRDRQGPVGTLSLTLRKLGLHDPEQTQLRELEDKIGPDALLGLLRERADLPALLNVLRYTSVEFAGSLIRALDRATMAEFIDRTIVLGSSIGTIAFPIGYIRHHLPECADRLDSMIGPDNLWRLFVSNGDLNDLSPLLPALGRSLRDAFISLEQGSECRWRDLTARSNFFAICRFARDCFLDLPEIVGCRLTQVIKASVTGSLQRTPWAAFASSRAIIEKLVPSDLKDFLMEAAGDRIARLGPDDLRAEDIETAPSLLLTVQHHRPDLWPIAARDFWRIVPPESTWPDDYHRLIAGRFLLQLASLPEVSKSDAERVIRAFTTRPPTLDGAESKVVWLFLWNLFSAWYERGRPFSDRFRGLQPLEFWDKLVQCVKQQAPRRRNEDKLNLLILAGLLRFLVPETAQVLRSELSGRLKGIRYLLNKTGELTMLPAFFALQGISILVPQRDVFTPERRRVLVEKASEYPQRTASLDLVCGWLRNEI